MTPLEFDRKHIWHPYTNLAQPGPVHMVTGADGVYLTLNDGSKVIDAMSSWWCAIHGHKHATIVEAMHQQIDTVPHVMFGGLTHEPAIALGQRLVDMTPATIEKIFYCDSGSVAVEIAMKMAVQYQYSVGFQERKHFATVRSGYHGDTWKAMSVCDPCTGMHHFFKGALSIQHFIAKPPIDIDSDWNEDPLQNGLGELHTLFANNADKIAGFIIEPVVQGAGGMYFYHPQYLNEVKKLCDEFGIVLIFDEIATGFGRTGKLFATDYCDIEPDIMCLGKALTGGHISFAATLTTSKIAEVISKGQPGTFMHGPTFMGNPIACSAALASLTLLQETNWQEEVIRISNQLKLELGEACDLKNVKDVRVLGAIGVIEMDKTIDVELSHRLAPELGVYLRPFGKNIYCMPPFISTIEEVSKITKSMIHLAEVTI